MSQLQFVNGNSLPIRIVVFLRERKSTIYNVADSVVSEENAWIDGCPVQLVVTRDKLCADCSIHILNGYQRIWN